MLRVALVYLLKLAFSELVAMGIGQAFSLLKFNRLLFDLP